MDVRLEFLLRAELNSVLFSSIGSIIISDHASVVMDIKIKITLTLNFCTEFKIF